MRLIFALALIVFASPAFAQDTYVRGHFRDNGTYVQPHYRSAPDGNPYNNWSSRGNSNPYTGSVGTRSVEPQVYYPQGSLTPSLPPTQRNNNGSRYNSFISRY